MNDDKKLTQEWFPPGSKEARTAGCTCPVLDNEYGAGAFMDGKIYYINCTCPIHGNNVYCDKSRTEPKG